ncbi:MAG: hypothetical protein ACKVS6_10805 [Planctomycetota bacterium]
MRKFLIRFGIVILSTLLCALLLEFALGFTNAGNRVVFRVRPRLGVSRAPNQKGVEPGNEFAGQWVPLTINSLGFRGPELAEHKQPGEIRIQCLGDSFVFGGGVGDDDTFPANAQKICNNSNPKPIWINSGGNGYDGREAAGYLDFYYPTVRPDIVVFGWNWNDLVSIAGESSAEITSFDSPRLKTLASLFGVETLTLRKTAIYKFVNYYQNPRQWNKPETLDAFKQEYLSKVVGAANGPGSADRWNLARKAISRMNELCKKHGSKYFVFVMPELTWKESARFVAIDKLEALLDSLKIPFVDAQPEFFDSFKAGRHMVQNLDPAHPSAEGQRMLAEVLVNALAKLKWIPEPAKVPESK